MGQIEEVIRIAKSRVGIKENPPNSNNVDANTWYYGHEVSGSAYPWCVTEIMYNFQLAKCRHLLPMTASSTYLYNSFKSKGRIYQSPKVGDIVFYYFSKNKKPGVMAEHVGIVTEVGFKSIKAIEGNTSVSGSQDNGGMVCEKTRAFGSYIVGYGRPQYEETTDDKKSNEEIAKEVIQGKWDSGVKRRQNLTQAGYDYVEIQKIVNQMLKG